MAVRPIIIVQTFPEEVTKGDMLTISARLFDPDTNNPMEVSRIFMNIISKTDGHEVWELEVIRKDAAGFDIQIGTNMMKEGHEYFIRVSNNWNMSPNGAATFKVKEPYRIPIIPLFLPLLREPVDDLKKRMRQIEKFIFRTQMDHRVCVYCKEHEDKIFYPDEAKPEIPIHFNCRCTYDVYFIDVNQLNASMLEIAEVVSVARKYRNYQEANIVKLVSAVEMIEN